MPQRLFLKLAILTGTDAPSREPNSSRHRKPIGSICHRRQRYAAGITRGTVAEQIGSTAVRSLVDGQAQHDRGQRKRQCDKCGAISPLIKALKASCFLHYCSDSDSILPYKWIIITTDRGYCHPNICSGTTFGGILSFHCGAGPALHDNFTEWIISLLHNYLLGKF